MAFGLPSRLPAIRSLAAVVALAWLAGCAPGAAPEEPRSPAASTPAPGRIAPAQAERLRRIMLPLLAAMDRPLPAGEVRIGVWADDRINAANAGGGAFYVTTGLLRRSTDDQLRGVMAHEIAHADLGHVARTQRLATGLQVGSILLERILPGSGAIAPVAGELVLRAYTRGEESEADAHAVAIMRRAGFDGRRIMATALRWIQETEGESGGGFLDSHPATSDRIQAVESIADAGGGR